VLLCFALSACGGGGDSAGNASYGNGLTITSPTTWSGQTVSVAGTLTIASGGCLTLTNSTLLFNPAVEDTGSFVIQGNGCLNVVNSTLKSGNGKQWNLSVQDTGAVSFTRSSVATNHSGLRFYNFSTLASDNSNVEEVQVHDSASLTVQNNSSAYIVAFFTGSGSGNFATGQFSAGNGISRTLNIPTSDTTTGSVSISNSNISGFQLDLQRTFNLSIGNANGVVLSLHLNNYTNNNYTNSITSATAGTADFSASGNPKFTWTNSQISSVNLYLTGTSNLVWNGTTTLNEVNTLDSSSLTLNSGVSLWADLAQSYNTSTMTLNAVTLLQDPSKHPSFTALDNSVIRINNTVATSQTTVYRVGFGQVVITGGSGW
jgi:hypothetical protein